MNNSSFNKSLHQSNKRIVNFNKRKIPKPTRSNEPEEPTNQLPNIRKISSAKQDFKLPDENSLHLFEPNLMEDEDFNDIKNNNDNKKAKSRGRRKIKKSNSMLGKTDGSEKPGRLNKSFQVTRTTPRRNMKPYTSETGGSSKVMRQDRHNEMSFKNKPSHAGGNAQARANENGEGKAVQPGSGQGRERNFTLGPMGFSNKLFQNFNAETQSKKTHTNDYNSQKTFKTESNNTNVFAAKSIQNKSVLTDVSNMEIKEDIRERQGIQETMPQNEYGYKELREQTSIENDLLNSRQSRGGDNLDSKIKKNIRNSIKEDSLFGEAFQEYLDRSENPFEVKPNKVFSISNNDPNYNPDSAFKKSKTETFQKDIESARISFEMTPGQLNQKRQEMRQAQKYEIEADKTLGNKSPSNRSISFENKAKNRFFVEKQNKKKAKRINKSNSMMLKMSDNEDVVSKEMNRSFSDFSEPEIKQKTSKSKNVFMSSVENNKFSKLVAEAKKKEENKQTHQSDRKNAKKVKMNPIIANKSLHSNFKFSSMSPLKGNVNMFGAPAPKGNMAYSSSQNKALHTISSISNQNPTSPNLPSNQQLYLDFEIDKLNEKNDSIDLMDEDDEEDFDFNFNINRKAGNFEQNEKTKNMSGNLGSKKNSLGKHLELKQRTNSPMILQKEIIDNSEHTNRSNTSHASGKKNFVHTFGKKNLEFEGNLKEARTRKETLQNRPKQFTFNNKMVLTSFKNKTGK